jgi:hypothetical protein
VCAVVDDIARRPGGSHPRRSPLGKSQSPHPFGFLGKELWLKSCLFLGSVWGVVIHVSAYGAVGEHPLLQLCCEWSEPLSPPPIWDTCAYNCLVSILGRLGGFLMTASPSAKGVICVGGKRDTQMAGHCV